jgi:hypothetical protein
MDALCQLSYNGSIKQIDLPSACLAVALAKAGATWAFYHKYGNFQIFLQYL